VKVGDLVKPSSKVQLLDSPFSSSEWNKVFLIVEGPLNTTTGPIFSIWRNGRKFLINVGWLEKYESR